MSKKDPLEAVYGNSQVWSEENGMNLIGFNKKKRAQEDVVEYGLRQCKINKKWEFVREYYEICKQDQFGKLLNLIQGNRKRYKRILTYWQAHIQGAIYRRYAPYKERKWSESEASTLDEMNRKFKVLRITLEWWLYYTRGKDRRDWTKNQEELNLKEMQYKDYFLDQLRYIEDSFLKKFRPILNKYYGERK